MQSGFFASSPSLQRSLSTTARTNRVLPESSDPLHTCCTMSIKLCTLLGGRNGFHFGDLADEESLPTRVAYSSNLAR